MCRSKGQKTARVWHRLYNPKAASGSKADKAMVVRCHEVQLACANLGGMETQHCTLLKTRDPEKAENQFNYS